MMAEIHAVTMPNVCCQRTGATTYKFLCVSGTKLAVLQYSCVESLWTAVAAALLVYFASTLPSPYKRKEGYPQHSVDPSTAEFRAPKITYNHDIALQNGMSMPICFLNNKVSA